MEKKGRHLKDLREGIKNRKKGKTAMIKRIKRKKNVMKMKNLK